MKKWIKVFGKKETDKQSKVEEQSGKEQEPMLILQELKKEEDALVEEKQNLVALKDKLRLKTKEEIENKKRNIQTLKNEIAELKTKCEELSKSLKAITG